MMRLFIAIVPFVVLMYLNNRRNRSISRPRKSSVLPQRRLSWH